MAYPTLTELITRVRQRSDNEHVGSNFVTDTEITGLLNVAYQELYAELIRAGLHIAETTFSVTATGAALYPLPTNLFAIIGIYFVDSGYKRRLTRHSMRFRPGSAQTGIATSYRIVSGSLELYPTPGSGSYEVVYVPQPALLSAGADTVDGVLGWEEYLVVDASIKVLQKEESDTSVLRGERERILARIQSDSAAEEMLESWTIDGVRPVTSASSGTVDPDRAPFRGYRGFVW